MKWEELSGRGRKRFCSACSLHVHDAAQLKRAEAQRLVAQATSRVCMRIEYDAHGRPLYLDTRPAAPSWTRRVARWTLTAAAGLLAACTGSSTPAPGAGNAAAPSPGPGKLGEVDTSMLGRVAAPRLIEMGGITPPPRVELGDVAGPAPTQPAEQD
jgi:hypothetical protein